MIYTVCGKIEPKEMGVTLGHEHFKWEDDTDKALMRYAERITDSIEDTHSFEMIMPILEDVKRYGCQTIVETSPPIGGENMPLLYRLSKASGIHIIGNTGWNIEKTMFDPNDDSSVERLANRWISDFFEGMDTVDNHVIRPGFIKLLLDRGKLSEVDKAMLHAAMIASEKTGMPIHCHILEAEMVYDVAAILDGFGFDFNRFLWAHVDKESDLEVIEFAIKKGMWLGIDQIRVGTEEERCKLLMDVIDRGASETVLLSQDYDFYEEAVADTVNHPCAYLFKRFMPYCIQQGMKQNQLESILRENPSRFYDIEITE